MCGIVGLLLKDPGLRPRLGAMMVPMLVGMTERGPDSSGMAVFTDSVAPLLRRVLPLASRFVCRTLRTTGIGESVVEAKIGGPLQRWVDAGLDLGYCARPGQVDVRLAARGGDAEQRWVKRRQSSADCSARTFTAWKTKTWKRSLSAC